MTPRALNVYKKQREEADRETVLKQDISAWMNGLYVLRAIGSVLSKDSEYPKHHILVGETEDEMSEEEINEIIHENTQIAAMNFAAWASVANSKE